MSRIFRTTLRLDPDKPASAQAATLLRCLHEERGLSYSALIIPAVNAYYGKAPADEHLRETIRSIVREELAAAPVHPSGDWDTRFVSASHALPQVSFLIDCLYEPDEALRKAVADSLIEDGTLRKIERWNAAHREEVTGDDTARAA